MSDPYDDGTEPVPNAFIQWKNTDLCMDFQCLCGAKCHFDGYFAYVVQCPHCRRQYSMPQIIQPALVTDGGGHAPKMMGPDEDHPA